MFLNYLLTTPYNIKQQPLFQMNDKTYGQEKPKLAP